MDFGIERLDMGGTEKAPTPRPNFIVEGRIGATLLYSNMEPAMENRESCCNILGPGMNSNYSKNSRFEMPR